MKDYEREYNKRQPNHDKPTWIKSSENIKPIVIPTYSLYKEASQIVDEAIALLVKKHEDYGPKNISDAPGGPMMGLAVRLHDKVARLANLIPNNKKPNHESIKDTFEDILNYAIIGLLVLEDKWDK